MVHYKEYENGLKLVVKEMPGMLSVSTGILVGAGSYLETDKNNGISHFIEHVNFKGTEKYSAFKLSDEFDSIGAQVNAFTSKDMTCYYVKSATSAVERSFELLADLFLNSTYEKAELDKEKDVIIEEVNMSEDTPEDLCLDKLSEAYFGSQGLGRTILGPKKNVKNFKKSDILDYKSKYYNADNIVVSFAGNITALKAEKLVEKYFAPFLKTEKTEKTVDIKCENLLGRKYTVKDIEQTHLALGFKGEKFNGEKTDELSLVNIILGMGMSSRLFQKVREELGLCYTIYSYPSGYRDTGTIIIYAGINNDYVNEAFKSINDVLSDIKSGVTDKEFERGKAQVLSSFAFGEESTASQMILYGKYLLFTGKIFNVKDKINNIVNMNKSSVDEYIKTLDFDDYSLATVSKNKNFKF